MPHATVSQQQRGRAKSLRQVMTRAETLLWRYLKGHHIDGLGFRRQVPFRGFVADFVCHSARIIVELDGESHDFIARQQSDRARDAWFQSQGYAVLRFTNEQVVTNLAGVVEVIRSTASSRRRPTSPEVPPSLSLPHKGGGNAQSTARRAATRKRGTGRAARKAGS
ncbi:MAG TPA: endonuclease domain-containing protein [Pseudolabrys sp.]|jgi:very-short-patch-repair endonuclease|nr:endonuclease domain-containing protein [Pseudolabrys sp.]